MWLIEMLAEVFLNFVLGIPGALVRWVLKGCRGKFSDVWMDDPIWNSFVGFLVLVTAVMVYNLASR